jgi:hypothetical protein
VAASGTVERVASAKSAIDMSAIDKPATDRAAITQQTKLGEVDDYRMTFE